MARPFVYVVQGRNRDTGLPVPIRRQDAEFRRKPEAHKWRRHYAERFPADEYWVTFTPYRELGDYQSAK